GARGCGQETGRPEMARLSAQVSPDMASLPQVSRLFETGEILHQNGQRVSAVNQHSAAFPKVFRETPIALARGEFAMVPDEHESIVFEAHASPRDIVLCRKLDLETILARPLFEIPQIIDVFVPLIAAVEIAV